MSTTADSSIVASNLEIPWEVAWLPSGEMLVTERPGRLVKIGADRLTLPVPDVIAQGEGGLLGLALHPDFAENNFLYLYLTTSNSAGKLINQVRRYRFVDNALSDTKIIFDNIPASGIHDGGRVAFGPDRHLYLTTGDANQSELAQDTSSLAGKILRLKDDGSIPADNHFGNAVYSYGHRNPQGLAWDSSNRLWATEHGRSGVASGFDEVNLIVKGGNYGWPKIQGDETSSGLLSPIIHSGSSTTWAPAGMAILNNRLFFGGLRGQSLYEISLDGEKVSNLTAHLSQKYGRLRAVKIGPDGFIYVTTSNQDGRGQAQTGDDKIIRIDPSRLSSPR